MTASSKTIFNLANATISHLDDSTKRVKVSPGTNYFLYRPQILTIAVPNQWNNMVHVHDLLNTCNKIDVVNMINYQTFRLDCTFSLVASPEKGDPYPLTGQFVSDLHLRHSDLHLRHVANTKAILEPCVTYKHRCYSGMAFTFPHFKPRKGFTYEIIIQENWHDVDCNFSILRHVHIPLNVNSKIEADHAEYEIHDFKDSNVMSRWQDSAKLFADLSHMYDKDYNKNYTLGDQTFSMGYTNQFNVPLLEFDIQNGIILERSSATDQEVKTYAKQFLAPEDEPLLDKALKDVITKDILSAIFNIKSASIKNKGNYEITDLSNPFIPNARDLGLPDMRHIGIMNFMLQFKLQGLTATTLENAIQTGQLNLTLVQPEERDADFEDDSLGILLKKL